MLSAHHLWVESVLTEVACAPFRFEAESEGQVTFVVAACDRPDRDTGLVCEGRTARYEVPVGANGDREVVVRRCLVAALAMAEHEVRESFQWRCRRVVDPHRSWGEIRADKEGRE